MTLGPPVKIHLSTKTSWGAFARHDAKRSRGANIKRKHCDTGQ